MKMNNEISEYIEKNIIPTYEPFDAAHNLEHVRKVIENSLLIAEDYEVDLTKVYVIAAYHDVGLSHGREEHEKTSAVFLKEDRELRKWFSEEELVLMAEAVEDHRASNNCEPRSIYGKIVSEADRDIDYKTVLRRTVQYSLANYPEYDMEQHFTRTYEHLQEKYGESGYLKLWLDSKLYRNKLKELRSMLMSKEKLRTDFEKVLEECKE